MDPPYYTTSEQGNFTQYTSDGFHLSKKMLLPKIFKELDSIGCKVMMSNSNVPAIHQYFKGYDTKILKARRMINSDGENRGYVNEVVVMNYKAIRRQRHIDEW